MSLNLKKYFIITLLTASYTASASVWSPTASDVNFYIFTPLGNRHQSLPSHTGRVGLFKDFDNMTAGEPFAEFSKGATVPFDNHGSKWTITAESIGASPAKITNLESAPFRLGWRSNRAWLPEAGRNLNPWAPNFWRLTFVDSSPADNNTETLHVANVEPTSPGVQNVFVSAPLPTATWSFMAGLMGILALGKFRHRE